MPGYPLRTLSAPSERVERVIALALERIPLAQIATGPEDEDGVGPRFRHHRNLGFVVERLDRFPGQGLALVHTALRSPSFFNRIEAVAALAAWGESRWGRETRTLLEEALLSEPDEQLRDRMGKLLLLELTD